MRKSEKWIYVIGVIALVITIIIGTTYSLWSVTKTQENENTIVVGEYANSCIKVTFEEPIVDEIAYPKTDEEGMKTSPLKFTLKNECEFTAEYEIHLEILDTNTIAERSVKAVLDNNTPKLVSEYTSTEAVIENATARILQRDMLETNEEKTYYFRKWIEEDATQSEVTDRTFDTKIAIVSIEQKEWDYAFVGEAQEFTVPVSGYYNIELWGASGGGNAAGYVAPGTQSGGYTKGNIYLNKGEIIYVFVGGKGQAIHDYNCRTASTWGGWNGGGTVTFRSNGGCSAGGGGATDVRLTSTLISTEWKNSGGTTDTSLKSRIMVASGGAGSDAHAINASYPTFTSNGGGLSGYRGIVNSPASYYVYAGYGASQTAGGSSAAVYTANGAGATAGTPGSFGTGGNGGLPSNATPTAGGGGGGGGGYYGGSGGSGAANNRWGGGGGSSFISGHTGSNAINEAGVHIGQANHYSGKVFTSTIMIDGGGYSWTNVTGALQQMPNPSGDYYASGTGHTGNGYARITFITK